MRITKLHLVFLVLLFAAGGVFMFYHVRQKEKAALEDINRRKLDEEAVLQRQAEEEKMRQQAAEQAEADQKKREEEQKNNVQNELEKGLEAEARAEKAPKLETKKSPEIAGSYTYKVRRGDSLWKIAKQKKYYGRGGKWIKIWKANKDKIKDYDRIYPGQVFVIPDHERR